MIVNHLAELWTVVDHGLVVVPEDVRRWLCCFPQITVKFELRASFDELFPCFFLLLCCFRFLCSFVLHLYLRKCICNCSGEGLLPLWCPHKCATRSKLTRMRVNNCTGIIIELCHRKDLTNNLQCCGYEGGGV